MLGLSWFIDKECDFYLFTFTLYSIYFSDIVLKPLKNKFELYGKPSKQSKVPANYIVSNWYYIKHKKIVFNANYPVLKNILFKQIRLKFRNDLN